jgi:diacylglycerol kinase family enzyme
VLCRGGHRVSALETKGPGSAVGIARQCVLDGADLILAAGGDGTVNEVANGVVGSNVPFGVLPAGTANMLAYELGISGTIAAIAGQVSGWVPRRICAGLLKAAGGVQRYFLMIAGVGLDAHIVSQVDPALKKTGGKLSYWIAGMGELGRELEEFDVEAGDVRRTVSFALISRVRNYGASVTITRHASLLGDDFVVALFEGRNPLRYLGYLAGVVTNKLEGMEGVTLLRARALTLAPREGSSVHVEVDGELAGALPASVEIVPDALTLLMPPGFISWTA